MLDAMGGEGERVRIEEVRESSAEIVKALGWLASMLPRFSQTPSAEVVEELMRSPTIRLLVARDGGGEVVGMLTLAVYPLPTGPRAWVEDVSVSTDHSGAGIGRGLVKEALSLAREAGAADAEIAVSPRRPAARHMVVRAGFGPNNEGTFRIRLM
jgi:predicted N-acetyltransferase YhbS